MSIKYKNKMEHYSNVNGKISNLRHVTIRTQKHWKPWKRWSDNIVNNQFQIFQKTKNEGNEDKKYIWRKWLMGDIQNKNVVVSVANWKRVPASFCKSFSFHSLLLWPSRVYSSILFLLILSIICFSCL